MKRKIVLLLADTHAGSAYGLTHPETLIECEGPTGQVEQVHPQLNQIQKFLFEEVYRPGLKQVMEFAGKDEVIVLHEGDATQGVKYEPSPISSQIQIAVMNLSEILQYENVRTLRLLKSTPSHALGEQSDSDILICDLLRRTFPNKSIATHWHGEYHIQDVDVLWDASHHGPGRGSRMWLEGNIFRLYLRDLLIRRMLHRQRAPDVVSRSHTHGKLEEHLTVEGHRCWGLITPPMQFPSAYVRQITRSVDEIEMGMLMVEIIRYSPKRCTIYPYWITKTLRLPTQEVL